MVLVHLSGLKFLDSRHLLFLKPDHARVLPVRRDGGGFDRNSGVLEKATPRGMSHEHITGQGSDDEDFCSNQGLGPRC